MDTIVHATWLASPKYEKTCSANRGIVGGTDRPDSTNKSGNATISAACAASCTFNHAAHTGQAYPPSIAATRRRLSLLPASGGVFKYPPPRTDRSMSTGVVSEYDADECCRNAALKADNAGIAAVVGAYMMSSPS